MADGRDREIGALISKVGGSAVSGAGGGTVTAAPYRGERAGVGGFRRLLKDARIDLGFGGLLLYTVVIITYRVPVGDVAVIAGVVGMMVGRQRITVPRYLWWMLCFIVWCALGYVFSAAPDLTQVRVTVLFKMWVVSLLAVNVLRSSPRLIAYATVFLVCFLTHPLRSIFTNFIRGISWNGRYSGNGEFYNPNQFALVTLLALGLSVALFLWHRAGSAHILAMICIVLCPAAILLTSSRGVLIGLVIFTILLVLGARRKGKAIVALSGILLVGIMVAPPQVWKRMSGLTKATSSANLREVDPEGSAAERYEIWKTGIRIFEDQPVMGAGAGTYSYMNLQYSPQLGRKDSHSTYLNVLAETGIVGFGLFGAMLLAVFRQMRRSSRPSNLDPTSRATLRVLGCTLIGVLIAALWGSYTTLSFFYLHLALISAVAAIAARGRPLAYASTQPAPVEDDRSLTALIERRLG